MQQLIALSISNTAIKCGTKNFDAAIFFILFCSGTPLLHMRVHESGRIIAKGSEEQLLLRNSVL